MRTHNLNRPGDFRSNNLWKLYSFLNDLEKYYIILECGTEKDSKGELFYICDMSIGGEDVQYAHYSHGDIPDRKLEWLKLKLVNLESGHENYFERLFETDAIYETDCSIDEMLDKYKLRIPSEKELKEYIYVELVNEHDGLIMSVPSLDGSDIPFDRSECQRWKYQRVSYKRETVTGSLISGFQTNNIAYRRSKEDPRAYCICFLSEDIPGLTIGGKINCSDEYMDVYMHHDSLPENTKKLHRGELLEKLNEMNSQAVIAIPQKYSKDHSDKNLTTLRFYLDDKNRVCVSTTIDYKIWFEGMRSSSEYITGYLPRLLEKFYSSLFS